MTTTVAPITAHEPIRIHVDDPDRCAAGLGQLRQGGWREALAPQAVLEAAAAAVAQMRDEAWSGPLAPDAVLRVDVQLPPVIHEVPFKALERGAAPAARAGITSNSQRP